MFKNLLKDSIIYGVSKYLGVFAAIFLMPIYTRILTKEDYGIMEIMNSWNAFVILILPLGLTSVIVRYYPDIKEHTKILKLYIGTIVLVLISVSIFYSLLMFYYKTNFLSAFDSTENSSFNAVFNFSIIITIESIFISFFLSLLQVQFRKMGYVLVTIINLILLIVLGYYFVAIQSKGIAGFFEASLYAASSSLIIAIMLNRKLLSLYFSNKLLKKILKYSIHILSVGLLFSATNLLDRFIIQKFIDIENVGIYSIGVRISGIVGLIISAFTLAWWPLSMKIKNDINAKEKYGEIHDLYFTLSILMLGGLILFRYELIYLFAPGYLESYFVIVILAAFLVISGSTYFYSLGIHIEQKAKYLTYSGISSMLVNVVISISLIDLLGINGIAIGTLIGGLVWIYMQDFFTKKFYSISFSRIKVFNFFFINICLTIATYFIDNLNLPGLYSIGFKSLLLLLLFYYIVKKLPKEIKKNILNYKSLVLKK